MLPILEAEGATMIFLHDIEVSTERNFFKNMNFITKIKNINLSYVKKIYKIESKFFSIHFHREIFSHQNKICGSEWTVLIF